jgi:hypothetical protein
MVERKRGRRNEGRKGEREEERKEGRRKERRKGERKKERKPGDIHYDKNIN